MNSNSVGDFRLFEDHQAALDLLEQKTIPGVTSVTSAQKNYSAYIQEAKDFAEQTRNFISNPVMVPVHKKKKKASKNKLESSMTSSRSVKSVKSTGPSYLDQLQRERALKGIAHHVRTKPGLNSVAKSTSAKFLLGKDPYAKPRPLQVKDAPVVTKYGEIHRDRLTGKNFLEMALKSHSTGPASFSAEKSYRSIKRTPASDLKKDLSKVLNRTSSAAKMPLPETASSDFKVSQTISAFSTKFKRQQPASKPKSFGKLELIFQPTARQTDPETGIQALKDMIFNQRQEIDELTTNEADLKRQLAEKESYIQSFKFEVDGLEQEREELRRKSATLEKSLNEASKDNVRALQKIKELEEQLKQRSQFEHDIISKLEDLSQKYKQQNSMLKELDIKNLELQKDKAGLSDDLQAQKDLNSEQVDQIQALLEEKKNRRRHSPFKQQSSESLNESKSAHNLSGLSSEKPMTYREIMKQSKQQMQTNLSKDSVKPLLCQTNIAFDHLLPSPVTVEQVETKKPPQAPPLQSVKVPSQEVVPKSGKRSQGQPTQCQSQPNGDAPARSDRPSSIKESSEVAPLAKEDSDEVLEPVEVAVIEEESQSVEEEGQRSFKSSFLQKQDQLREKKQSFLVDTSVAFSSPQESMQDQILLNSENLVTPTPLKIGSPDESEPFQTQYTQPMMPEPFAQTDLNESFIQPNEMELGIGSYKNESITQSKRHESSPSCGRLLNRPDVVHMSQISQINDVTNTSNNMVLDQDEPDSGVPLSFNPFRHQQATRDALGDALKNIETISMPQASEESFNLLSNDQSFDNFKQRGTAEFNPLLLNQSFQGQQPCQQQPTRGQLPPEPTKQSSKAFENQPFKGGKLFKLEGQQSLKTQFEQMEAEAALKKQEFERKLRGEELDFAAIVRQNQIL